MRIRYCHLLLFMLTPQTPPYKGLARGAHHRRRRIEQYLAPPAVILKPRTLGAPSNVTVEYVRGTDSALAGSRDALGPLLMCLKELRFGSSGIRDVYGRCQSNREALCGMLHRFGVKVDAPRGSLDVIIESHQSLSESTQKVFGLRHLTKNLYLATV